MPRLRLRPPVAPRPYVGKHVYERAVVIDRAAGVPRPAENALRRRFFPLAVVIGLGDPDAHEARLDSMINQGDVSVMASVPHAMVLVARNGGDLTLVCADLHLTDSHASHMHLLNSSGILSNLSN